MNPAAPAEKRNIRVTALFALAGVLMAAAAMAIGTGDNPPGLALAYGASAAFVLALAHPWRRPRRWLALAAGSLVGGFVVAILHNFPEVLAERMTDAPVLSGILGFAGVTLFLLAVLVAPAAIVVGLAGFAVTAVRNRVLAKHAA